MPQTILLLRKNVDELKCIKSCCQKNIPFCPSTAPRQPLIIKGNKEGLMALVFATINAIANSNKSSCELFDGEGEVFEAHIKVAQIYKELEDKSTPF